MYEAAIKPNMILLGTPGKRVGTWQEVDFNHIIDFIIWNTNTN